MIFEISKENESIFLLNFSKIHKAPEWMLLPFKKKFLRNKKIKEVQYQIRQRNSR